MKRPPSVRAGAEPVLDRRQFLGKVVRGAPLLMGFAGALALPDGRSYQPRPYGQLALGEALAASAAPRPDFELAIEPMALELAPGKIVQTYGYANRVPGPLIRVREGATVTIKVTNRTDRVDIVHWHGLMIPSEVDGAVEEGTPPVKPNESRLYTFVARPSGSRWYHSHAMAGKDLTRSLYTGQFGFFYIEPQRDPGHYDREFFIAMHHWEPSWVLLQDLIKGPPPNNGFEVGYGAASFNDKALGHGEPLRVRQGQRVLFHLLNASATQEAEVALSGHKFTVLALDGNPVPAPRTLERLYLAPAERIDAVVEMNNPGVWIFGATAGQWRAKGLGAVVEYANASGPPRFELPPKTPWDYKVFGRAPSGSAPEERISLLFQKIEGGPHGFNRWTINGKSWPHTDPIIVQQGKRYRMELMNFSGDMHPIHLHRHTFELATFMGQPTAGVLKDVVALPPRQQLALDFTADDPGPSLFHCHMQDHQDFGFMALLKYA